MVTLHLMVTVTFEVKMTFSSAIIHFHLMTFRWVNSALQVNFRYHWVISLAPSVTLTYVARQVTVGHLAPMVILAYVALPATLIYMALKVTLTCMALPKSWNSSADGR